MDMMHLSKFFGKYNEYYTDAEKLYREECKRGDRSADEVLRRVRGDYGHNVASAAANVRSLARIVRMRVKKRRWKRCQDSGGVNFA